MSCLRWSVVLGLVAMTVGCDGEGVELNVEDSGLWDADGDGYAPAEMGGLDCLDSDPAVSPEGVELPYDGLDNDCDPTTRDDDLDGDGYPSAEDCNDARAAVSPGAEDRVGDGRDDNCDGLDGIDAQAAGELGHQGHVGRVLGVPEAGNMAYWTTVRVPVSQWMHFTGQRGRCRVNDTICVPAQQRSDFARCGYRAAQIN